MVCKTHLNTTLLKVIKCCLNKKGEGKFGVDQIDPYLCTHVVYAFAVLDPVTLTIQSGDPIVDIAENGWVIDIMN